MPGDNPFQLDLRRSCLLGIQTPGTFCCCLTAPPVSWALQGALAQAPAQGEREEEKAEEGFLCDGVTVCQGPGQCDLSPHSPTLLQPWASLLGSVIGSCLPATIAGCAQEFVKLPPVPGSCYLCPVAPTPARSNEQMRPGLNFAGSERIFLAQTE